MISINVYDFDKTIYSGDSTLDFLMYCIRRHPLIIKAIPLQILALFKYKLKKCNKTEFKERFFVFLCYLKNVDEDIEKFWDLNYKKINEWYRAKDHSNDVIISASPEFLLQPIIKKLNDSCLIASKVDKFTGRFTGNNCYGIEKVRRLNEKYKNYTMLSFYSDSESDKPLAEIAVKSYLVKNNEIKEWIL